MEKVQNLKSSNGAVYFLSISDLMLDNVRHSF
jgi:hypothetical protein